MKEGEQQIYSFDPWGQRRNPQDWTFDKVPTSFLFDRGYTGHEHMDKFDLINMNGRCYDPWLGRMLSPDPFVQAPTYSQSYNRYTYAFNNPLKYTDPSGYFQHDIMLNRYNAGGNGVLYSAGSHINLGNPFSGYGGAGSNGIYFYNWNTGSYEHTAKGEVSYEEVYNNYVVPNSLSQSEALVFFDNMYSVNNQASVSAANSALNEIDNAFKNAQPGLMYFSNDSPTNVDDDSAEQECNNCIDKEIFAEFVKMGAEYISHEDFINEGKELMRRPYGGYTFGGTTALLTTIMSYSKYAKGSTTLGLYLSYVGFSIGISNDIRHNSLADIHDNYNVNIGLDVFSVSKGSLYNYEINYYDAKTGNYLGVVNFYKYRTR